MTETPQTIQLRFRVPEDALQILTDARVFYDHFLSLSLQYPRSSPIKGFFLSLMDVRAADCIRIHYDFDRDGWAIEQEHLKGSVGCVECYDPPWWSEVAFVPSWQLEKDEK